ncbi:alpha/beta fold hydrolase [Reyranella aquatilis]|uniref:Alpha/beta fold hydrolase n=1 Tax=Reyranella aquatilis TaxID=2035356 RepID=A0ABS8KQQ5_9HYPH|nr:alpha/beta fold hydrolase [Reyranella aquatilis]MCC8428393.1 alpha/beta fold hydrolase [Reyranella aquatilis]
MAKTKANGIEIEYETFGRKGDPALLLIMGLGAQLTLWPESLCEGLAGQGFFVVRYDNRDVGLSTDFDKWGVPDLMGAFARLMKGEKVEAPYLLGDMAADAIGLLDALDIDRAHMVGASMGGMIAQVIAGTYPQRTRSLVSIMSTSGRIGLPMGKPEAVAMLSSLPEGPAREQLIAHGIKLRSVIGSPGYPTDPARMRALVERNIDRRYYPAGAARQYLSIMVSGPRVDLLKTVKVPTLVLHGEDDPLLPVECGRDVASLVPGAKIETFPGWGHDVPEQMVPKLVGSISGFCKSA